MKAVHTTWGIVTLQMICARSRILLVLLMVAWLLDVLSR